MNNISINDQDKAVAEYLKAQGIKFNVDYAMNKENDKEWACDVWNVSFNSELFTYKTGLGHRLEGNPKTPYTPVLKPYKRDIEQLHSLLELSNRISAVHKVKERTFAVRPTQASVLYCLLLDAEASNDSFNNWCDAFGYDNDSLLAFKTYQACCDSAIQLSKVFTREQLNELNVLLEEY